MPPHRQAERTISAAAASWRTSRPSFIPLLSVHCSSQLLFAPSKLKLHLVECFFDMMPSYQVTFCYLSRSSQRYSVR